MGDKEPKRPGAEPYDHVIALDAEKEPQPYPIFFLYRPSALISLRFG